MRLEFNPRAMCYNLYCDTQEDYEKMRQMLEVPLTATDVINSIDNMLYADTDSIKTMRKNKLNSVYGKVVTDMAKEYIVVHRDNQPMIIFTKSIMAVEKDTKGKAVIYCTGSSEYWTDNKYADVIKQLI